MFDIAWTEILIIAIVAILVVGPRELPAMLRSIGKFMGQMRRMAGDFQRQFNDAIREAELDDVKRGIDGVRSANPMNKMRDSLNPLKQAGDGVRKAIEDPGAPKTAGNATSTAKSAASTARSTSSDASTAKPATGAAKAAPKKPAAKSTTAKSTTARSAAKKPAAAKSPAKSPASRSAAKPATAKPAAAKPRPKASRGKAAPADGGTGR